MELSKEALTKFKEAYQKDFGVVIVSDDEAKEMATRLLRFVYIISKPIPAEKRGEMRKIAMEYKNYLQRICKDCQIPTKADNGHS